jgi:hypothetical protein
LFTNQTISLGWMDGTEIDISEGRPRLRWSEDVEEWRRILQEAEL